MANSNGLRAVVTDPLAANPRERSPDRSLQVGGVMTPHTPSAASLTTNDGLTQALQGVEGVLAQEFEKKKDEYITAGKVAYQSGVTEHEIIASGNEFTAQGYRTLQARDRVNNWFTQQTIDLDTNGMRTDPQTYAATLQKQRAAVLNEFSDPYAKKVASAAFEDMSPRLASAQAIKHNEFNRVETGKAFSSALVSVGATSSTASKSDPNNPLLVSPVPVGPTLKISAKDRDVGIRTMLGEAGNEGADGLAAVAHVMRNRTTDARWPGTIEGVALQPKQFSTWNAGAGGNAIPYNAKPGSPAYERAGQVFDTVMSGQHVDPTGGATHYYSPAGMQKLVNDGDQPNVIPQWLDDETKRSGGRVKIGGHIFVGKSTGTTSDGAPSVPVPQNEVMEMIDRSSLKGKDKATSVADAVRRSLDSGDEKLFNDVGGVSILHKLGAQPGEIDEVIKAKKRFDDKKLTDFSSDNVKFEDDMKRRAEAGEDRDVLVAEIEKRHKSGLLNDANARALATTVADKIRAQDKDKSQMGNIDMLHELGGLYQNIATGSMDEVTAAKQAKKIAEKHGATEKDTTQIIAKMFSDSQAYQNHLRTKVDALGKTKAEQDGIKAEVTRAISNGSGLDNVTGSVKDPNDLGKPAITAKQWGINQIKDRWGKIITDKVNSGELDQGKAKGELERGIALELQEHGVVDEKQSAEFKASLTGNIISKDGTVKPEAKQAYDSWLSLRTAQNITPAYLAKMVPDDTTRNLLEHAFLYDGGTLSKEQALLKAHERLNNPITDPQDKANMETIWRKNMDVDLSKALLETTHPGFLASVFGTQDRSERERILTQTSVAQKFVLDQAWMYHQMEPREEAAVSQTKAIQDLQRRAVPVMGNLIITKEGKELDKTMGVTGLGPGAAEAAISDYLRKEGPRIWGPQYAEQQSRLFSPIGGRSITDMIGNVVATKPSGYDRPSSVAGALSTIGNIDRQFSPQGIARAISPKFESASDYKGERSDAPPLHITYNAELGVITVDLYKDAERTQTLGNPKTFDVKSLGARYVKEQTTPGTVSKTWNSIFKVLGKGVNGDNMENVYNAN